MLFKVLRVKSFIGPKVWRYFLVSTILGIAWFGVESFFVFVLQGFLLAIGILDKSQVLLPSWYPKDLIYTVAILICFGIVRALVSMLRVYYATQTQITFICEQRRDLFSIGLNNASEISSSNLISIFSDIVNQSGLVMYLVSNVVTTLVAAVLFFLLSLRIAPTETVMGVVFLFVFLFPVRKYSLRVNHYGKIILQEWEKITEMLMRGLRNHFLLKVYNQIDVELKKCDKSLEIYQSNYKKYSILAGVVSSAPMLIGVVLLSLISYVSIIYIKTDGIKLLSFVYLFVRMAQSSSELSGVLSHLRLHSPGFKELLEWKEQNKSIVQSAPVVEVSADNVKIDFNNVSFGYDNSKDLIQNMNFKIKNGSILVIKGESGTGKSTLLSLVLDLLKPNKGTICINGQSTSDYNIKLNKILAYVGPEPFLISGTIKNNLLYGNEKMDVTDEDLWHCLRVSEIENLVAGLPQKLNENVKDIAQFSTGQKQRIAIARAILRKPKLLIFDEATANLDSETEKKIISNMKEIFEGCTTIVVTHKNSFDEISTEIINLNMKASV